ncbi:unnamed protein product, partial [Prorocentrum cordatum]
DTVAAPDLAAYRANLEQEVARIAEELAAERSVQEAAELRAADEELRAIEAQLEADEARSVAAPEALDQELTERVHAGEVEAQRAAAAEAQRAASAEAQLAAEAEARQRGARAAQHAAAAAVAAAEVESVHESDHDDDGSGPEVELFKGMTKTRSEPDDDMTAGQTLEDSVVELDFQRFRERASALQGACDDIDETAPELATVPAAPEDIKRALKRPASRPSQNRSTYPTASSAADATAKPLPGVSSKAAGAPPISGWRDVSAAMHPSAAAHGTGPLPLPPAKLADEDGSLRAGPAGATPTAPPTFGAAEPGEEHAPSVLETVNKSMNALAKRAAQMEATKAKADIPETVAHAMEKLERAVRDGVKARSDIYQQFGRWLVQQQKDAVFADNWEKKSFEEKKLFRNDWASKKLTELKRQWIHVHAYKMVDESVG